MLSFFKKFIPQSVMRLYHYTLAMLAAFIYNNPSSEMIVIGVTGTNGKSSVVELIRAIFESAGFNSASLSSIRTVINEKEEMNMRKMTMPGRFALQKFLRLARAHGASHVVLEATSEGIRQFRHRAIDWDGLVFTNIAPEHIESHGSFEEYQGTKEKLFAYLSNTPRKGRTKKIIVVNADDARAKDFLRYDADEKWAYAASSIPVNRMQSLLHTVALDDLGKEDSALIAPSSYTVTENGIDMVVDGIEITSALRGEFNVYNILAAVALARAYGIEWAAIKKGIEEMKIIPGRLEYIQKEPFAVVVDYAHTPDALRKVYGTLRSANSKLQNLPPSIQKESIIKDGGIPLSNTLKENKVDSGTNNKLICVLGAAGGGRDTWKRPEFGKIAAEFCNEIILTNEDSYDENPNQILSEIESGIFNFQFSIFKVLDRGEAIRKAIQDAKPGDTVILTGKGSEQWIVGKDGVMIPWDEREFAREALAR